MLLLGLGGWNRSFSQDGWKRRMKLLETVSGGGLICCMFTCCLFCVLTWFFGSFNCCTADPLTALHISKNPAALTGARWHEEEDTKMSWARGLGTTLQHSVQPVCSLSEPSSSWPHTHPSNMTHAPNWLCVGVVVLPWQRRQQVTSAPFCGKFFK